MGDPTPGSVLLNTGPPSRKQPFTVRDPTLIAVTALVLVMLWLLFSAFARARAGTASEALTQRNVAIGLGGAYAMVLLMLPLRRTRGVGYVVAATVSLVISVLSAPFAFPALLALLGGRLSQYVAPFILPLLINITLLFLAGTGIRQRRAGPLAWMVGILVPFVWGGAIYRTDRSRIAAERGAYEKAHADENTMEHIGECAFAYRQAHRSEGYPADLRALGPQGSRCLDEKTAAGEFGAYRLTYITPIRLSTAPTMVYYLCAQPMPGAPPGRPTMWMGSARTVTFSRETSTANDVVPCARAISSAYHDYTGLLKFCVLAYAHDHPGEGYPESLHDMHACLSGLPSDAKPTERGLRTSHARYDYVAGLRNEQGVIDRFMLYRRSRGGVEYGYVNQGEYYYEMVKLEGTQSATPPHEIHYQVKGPKLVPDVFLADLEHGCNRGIAAACYAASQLHARATDASATPARAAQLMSAACGNLGEFPEETDPASVPVRVPDALRLACTEDARNQNQ